MRRDVQFEHCQAEPSQTDIVDSRSLVYLSCVRGSNPQPDQMSNYGKDLFCSTSFASPTCRGS